MLMVLYTGEDYIFCKTFTITLRGFTFTWFISLPLHSITSFYIFARKFVARFITGVSTKQILTYLFSVIQVPNETLKDYITSFNSETLQIQADIVVEVMKKRAWHKGLFDSLEKSPLETIKELMMRADKYIRLDDALRVKRQHDPHFNKKKAIEEKTKEKSE